MNNKIRFVLIPAVSIAVGIGYSIFHKNSFIDSDSPVPIKPGIGSGVVIVRCPKNAVTQSVVLKDRVVFTLDGKQYVLPRVDAASGQKFANAKMEFWGNDKEVTITNANSPNTPIQCEISHHIMQKK
jgi:Membrane-bound lysozyme-inhibitor of c-type lysozyme